MVRSREDEVRQPELANRVEALQLKRLEQIEGERLEADRPVDRVGDRLKIRHLDRPTARTESKDSFESFRESCFDSADGPSASSAEGLGERVGVGAGPHRVGVLTP